MKPSLILFLAVLAAIGGLVGGAILGVVFAGLLFGLLGAGLVVLIGWGAGRMARGGTAGQS